MQIRFITILILTAMTLSLRSQAGFDRQAYYSAIMGHDLREVDQQLLLLGKTEEKEAFRGALLMKKAGLLRQAEEKLSSFKTGHGQLESAIQKDSSNTEYRFLRLLIQENAPRVVNYRKEIKRDAAHLRTHYQSLSPGLQKAILRYSKTSGELKPEDFKPVTHG